MESQNMLVVVEGEAYDTRGESEWQQWWQMKQGGEAYDTRGESEYCPAAVVTDETGWWVEDWTRREERASQRGHWWTLSLASAEPKATAAAKRQKSQSFKSRCLSIIKGLSRICIADLTSELLLSKNIYIIIDLQSIKSVFRQDTNEMFSKLL